MGGAAGCFFLRDFITRIYIVMEDGTATQLLP